MPSGWGISDMGLLSKYNLGPWLRYVESLKWSWIVGYSCSGSWTSCSKGRVNLIIRRHPRKRSHPDFSGPYGSDACSRWTSRSVTNSLSLISRFRLYLIPQSTDAHDQEDALYIAEERGFTKMSGKSGSLNQSRCRAKHSSHNPAN
jgi:hypothetical protein